MTKISAGSYDLNKWLHGGWENDVISCIYGASGSGKTNFCLLAAVSQAKKGNKVIFMDTEGGFSVERVKQLVGDEDGYDIVLKNIMVLKPTSFAEQKKDFDSLLEYVDKQVSLIVIDGMTILYRLEFAAARDKNKDNSDDSLANSSELSNGQFSKKHVTAKRIFHDGDMGKINSELVRQLRTLAEISRKKEIPVLVTNQIYNWDNESKMVGGDILKYWSKCHVELANNKGTRMEFVISNSGVKKKGFLL